MGNQMVQAFRLSAQQRRLWQAQADRDIYFAQCAVRLLGELDSSALRSAFQNIVRRNEILRTGFTRRPGIRLPFQIVDGEDRMAWASSNGHTSEGGEPLARADLLLQRHRELPCDLGGRAPLRLELHRLAPREHLLLVLLPSLCADGWSLKNLVAEAARAYGMEIAGDDWDGESLQYVDFCQWQEEILAEGGEALETGQTYWAGLDASTAGTVRFPLEKEKAGDGPFEPALRDLELGEDLGSRLMDTAQRLGTTEEMFLLTCWQVLLWRLTRRSDLRIGRVFDGRGLSDLADALGLFASCLPVAGGTCDGLPVFRQLLGQLEEEVARAGELQLYGLLEREGSSPDDELPALFEFADWRSEPLAAGLRFSLVRQSVCLQRFKVKLSCIRARNRISLELHYDPEIFPGEEIELWLSRLRVLLAAAIADPEMRVGDLPVLAKSEHRQIRDWNRTERDFSSQGLVASQFERQAELLPEAVAVVCEGRELTYGTLNRRANRLAHHLRSLGVRPDDRIALLLERSEEALVGLIGVLKAGGAYLPLDVTFPKRRLEVMLEDSQASVVVVQESLRDLLPSTDVKVVSLDGEARGLDSSVDGNPVPVADAGNLAYVLFTSGSTGRPKGVAVEHRQLCNYLGGICERLDLPAAGSFAVISTLTADLGNTMIFPSLCRGGCLHVISQERASNPTALAEYFRRYSIDCLKIVPSHLGALMVSSEAADLLPRQRLVLGGEASSWEMVETIARLAPGCRIFNHYGPTETTVGVLTYRVEGGGAPAQGGRLPLGRPLPNASVYLLDQRLQPTPSGVPGEIHIGGAGLARGYLGRSDLTAERFIPNPFADPPGGRLYRTGDLARFLPDGAMEFLGRLDHQVKIRGFRIELGEIQSVLMQHPQVWDAVVVVRQNPVREKRLVAYVVPRNGRHIPPEELRVFLRERLAEPMVPSGIVSLVALPVTANGKVDLQALPEEAEAQSTTVYTAPRTPVEQNLARLWCEILGVERIGVHDNFFDLGGDSILAIQVIARANRLGYRLRPKQLFEHQTIATLAGAVGSAPEVLAEQGLVVGTFPLTPIQRWFFEQGFSDRDHWNQSFLFEMTDEIAPAALEEATQRLVEHHDSLRLRFWQDDDGWRQAIVAPAAASGCFARVDLSALPEEPWTQAVEAVMTQAQASLSLSEGLLFRLVLLEAFAGKRSRLGIVVHHLVMDGVSWRILMEDLGSLCRGLGRGTAVTLPPKTTSFRQWAERLPAYAASSELLTGLEAWLSALPEECEPLPRDFPEGENLTGSEQRLILSLSPEETRLLLQEVPAAYRTQTLEVLVTALALGFRRWSGRRGVLVELEGHGREGLFDDLDLSRTVGWFTTHFPVWLEVEEQGQPGAALKAVKERLRSLPHRGIGYGLLRFLAPEGEGTRRLRSLPEPEVKFNYLGQLDHALADSVHLRPAAESGGPIRSQRSRRPRLLAIDGLVVGGALRLQWVYSDRIYREDTVQELAAAVHAELRRLIDHCLQPGIGECTPSDFLLARLDQNRLDRLVSDLSTRRDRSHNEPAHRFIEDLYPLSPLQKSLLFHLLSTPGTTVGFEQKVLTVRGDLELEAFRQTWNRVMDRHAILRTSFSMSSVEETLQVVHRQARISLDQHDWRSLSEAECQLRLQEYLQADREQGFDLAKAPLMRVASIRVSDEIHHIVWSYSHLLLDAWCRTLVVREVFALYGALCGSGEIRLPHSPPYRDYIAWLQRQDREEAEEFWRRYLEGFTSPTQLWIEHSAKTGTGADRSSSSAVSVSWTLPATEALQAFSRRHQITLGTLIQGAWAILLGHFSGDQDVVYGLTVSGRPAELPDAESMLGMFVNNLPVRAQMPGEAPAVSWLQQLQDEIAEVRQYEWCSLDQLREWSAVPLSQRLFETLVLFQNYPLDELGPDGSPSGLTVLAYQGRLETSYPLTFVASAMATLKLEIHYATRLFDSSTASRLVENLQALLIDLSKNPERPLSALSLFTEAERQQVLVEWASRSLESMVPAVLAPLFDDWIRRYPELSDRMHRPAVVYLLDRTLRPVPPGVPGEIFVSWGDRAGGRSEGEKEIAERWVPDPFTPSSGACLFRTGSLARFLSDGRLEILGRVDRWEVFHGSRIHLGIIEATLRRYPGLGEAAVRRVETKSGEAILVAYTVPEPGAAPTSNELRAFLQARLPRRWVPPVFLSLSHLPLTPEGEVDSTALPTPEVRHGHEALVAPRDPLEQMLVQIWEDLFGIHPLGIRDDFFELGGHSLLALGLLSSLPSHFGRNLSLATLLGASTVEKLADVLRQDVESRPWSPLVVLQQGGRRPPLFCVHPLGGEVLCYRDLAAYLGPDQPFYALQSRVWEELSPHESVEEMAACYLEAIRTVQPAGPYYLMGWSLGGLVALEMAQQLTVEREEIALLAVLDTGISEALEMNKSERDDAEWIVRYTEILAGRKSPLSVEALRQLGTLEAQLSYALDLAERERFLPSGIDRKTARRYFLAGTANGKAGRKYQPKPYTGSVTLFRAAEGHVVHAREPSLGWAQLAQGGLEIYEVPGTHDNMVLRPHVRTLAEVFRNHLKTCIL
jgi:amino acid adenylation domain-containing protein/non-ribosomal peptide synthase protein (TIGR01720 family)